MPSQVHHVPHLPTSASNIGMQPGALCLRVETFSQRVQALYDTGGSRHMSPYKPDFDPDSLRPSTLVVKTMGGALKMNQMEGTLRWTGVTDAGLEVKFPLENSVYVPYGDTRIFSPQHWAQSMLKQHPKCEAEDRMRGGKEFIMSWKLDNVLHTITMPIDLQRNVAHIYVDMPDDAYSAYVSTAGLSDDSDPILLDPSPAAVVTEDEASIGTDAHHPDLEEDWHDDWTVSDSEGAAGVTRDADFDFAKDDPQSETVAIDPDEEEKLESLSAEMLRLHHKFNHISFGKIRALARLGVVNPKLATCPSPACSACLYGKMTRRAWRFKPKSERHGTSSSQSPNLEKWCQLT